MQFFVEGAKSKINMVKKGPYQKIMLSIEKDGNLWYNLSI